MSSEYELLLKKRDKIKEKIKIIENRKQYLINSEAVRKRKMRTRNLIQKGALLEKYFGLQMATVEETEIILYRVSDYVIRNISDYKKNETE